MSTTPTLTHAEVLELAPLYVLGALDEHEVARVRAHLASCAQPHPDLDELGRVVPHLADALEPVDAPPELRARILAAVAEDARLRSGSVASQRPAVAGPAVAGPAVVGAAEVPSEAARREEAREPVALRARGERRTTWTRFALPVAAAFVIAALGGWNLLLQRQIADAGERAALLTSAVAALGTPGTSIARLTPTGGSPGAAGVAVVPRDGPGYLVLVGLPEAPAGKTYQAWYVSDVGPASIGLLRVEEGAPAVLAGLERRPGVEQVAVTVEPEGGSASPTTQPIVAGAFET